MREDASLAHFSAHGHGVGALEFSSEPWPETGAILQQPFEFGYQSVILLEKALKGDRSGIPASKQMFIPTMVIRQNNVDEFRTKLTQLRGR